MQGKIQQAGYERRSSFSRNHKDLKEDINADSLRLLCWVDARSTCPEKESAPCKESNQRGLQGTKKSEPLRNPVIAHVD